MNKDKFLNKTPILSLAARAVAAAPYSKDLADIKKRIANPESYAPYIASGTKAFIPNCGSYGQVNCVSKKDAEEAADALNRVWLREQIKLEQHLEYVIESIIQNGVMPCS